MVPVGVTRFMKEKEMNFGGVNVVVYWLFAWMKVAYIACLLYFGWIVVYWIMIIEWWFGPMSYLVTIYFQQFDIINVTRQQIITLTHCFKHYYHLDHYLCKGVSSLTLKEVYNDISLFFSEPCTQSISL